MTIGFSTGGTAGVGDCPPSPGNGNICSASDFSVAAVVTNGPDECTTGDTFPLTLDVTLASTARERFDIGLFAGDAGESVIEGASCSFTSLEPVEGDPSPVFNANSGLGAYRDLDGDGDLCGDVAQDEPVVRTFDLPEVLCQDNDGDGRVDISGLVTWSSNKNDPACTEPGNPQAFWPEQSSKCQLDPDLNLPIIVEPPPSLGVSKLALPGSRPAPGGEFVYVVSVSNASSATDTLTLNTLSDDIYGDITQVQGRIVNTNCQVPQALSPGEFYACEFTATFQGSSGDSETDTVTATAEDDEGNTVAAMDDATVRITDEQATMAVVKGRAPAVVREPGGAVTYFVLVANTSDAESITVESLEDDLYGNVFDLGSCDRPTNSAVLDAGEYFICSFEEQVSGVPGDVITDTITASGVSENDNPVGPVEDSASVTIIDVPSAIEVDKIAIPPVLPEPGGTFAFLIQVQNVSPRDIVTLDIMRDRIGLLADDITQVQGPILSTTCSLPQVLAPNEIYQCQFEREFTGQAGDYQGDQVRVVGIDDDGEFAADVANAQVFITDLPSEIEVIKTASPSQIQPPGNVTFSVTVINNSIADAVTITSLTDDIHGDITQVQGSVVSTTCSVSQVIAVGGFYSCEFVATVDGTAPDIETDTVTASGTDDDDNPVTDSASAEVLLVTAPPLPPKQIAVTKVAAPTTLPEPGGNVLYAVLIENTSGIALRVTGLLDDVYDVQGDDGSKEPVSNALNCAPPFDIAAGGRHLCLFTGEILGEAGDFVTDTVTVAACDPTGCANTALTDMDDATVSITPGPASIAVNKTASPATIGEPGADVTFTVQILNTSESTQVTIDTLSDDIYGDITQDQGAIVSTDCTTGVPIAAGDTYSCDFVATVSGTDGDLVTDVVTATGTGANGDAVEGQDDATVTILGTAPSLEITKTASPRVLQEPGGTVTFTVTITNSSAADTLTIDGLADDVYGDLDGQGDCSLPQSLAPAARYSCSFPGQVSGAAPDLHVDTITVTASTADGESLSDRDSAFVLIRAIADTMGIPTLSVWGLLGVSTLLAGLGAWRLRRRRAN